MCSFSSDEGRPYSSFAWQAHGNPKTMDQCFGRVEDGIKKPHRSEAKQAFESPRHVGIATVAVPPMTVALFQLALLLLSTCSRSDYLPLVRNFENVKTATHALQVRLSIYTIQHFLRCLSWKELTAGDLTQHPDLSVQHWNST